MRCVYSTPTGADRVMGNAAASSGGLVNGDRAGRSSNHDTSHELVVAQTRQRQGAKGPQGRAGPIGGELAPSGFLGREDANTGRSSRQKRELINGGDVGRDDAHARRHKGAGVGGTAEAGPPRLRRQAPQEPAKPGGASTGAGKRPGRLPRGCQSPHTASPTRTRRRKAYAASNGPESAAGHPAEASVRPSMGRRIKS